MKQILYKHNKFRIVKNENKVILQINIIFNFYKTICVKSSNIRCLLNEDIIRYNEEINDIVKQYKNIILYCNTLNIDLGY